MVFHAGKNRVGARYTVTYSLSFLNRFCVITFSQYIGTTKQILRLCLAISGTILLIACDQPTNQHTDEDYTEIGLASYYADSLHKNITASGDIYKKSKKTAAHPSLPFGTKVRVTNLSTQKSVVVKVNDRGKFENERVIILSKKAFKKISHINAGLINVKLEVLVDD